MNTPNKLTVARMILVPFLVVFLLTGWGGEANRWICLAIFVAASVTDWFDGHLARKYNLITNFGKFMDPLADKLLVCSAMICMIEVDVYKRQGMNYNKSVCNQLLYLSAADKLKRQYWRIT